MNTLTNEIITPSRDYTILTRANWRFVNDIIVPIEAPVADADMGHGSIVPTIEAEADCEVSVPFGVAPFALRAPRIERLLTPINEVGLSYAFDTQEEEDLEVAIKKFLSKTSILTRSPTPSTSDDEDETDMSWTDILSSDDSYSEYDDPEDEGHGMEVDQDSTEENRSFEESDLEAER